MKIGTKSLLFGVHHFILHPVSVLIAWCKLYGRPSLHELVCIVIHDWGYWGKPNMDGPEGEAHPEGGARLARLLLDREFYLFKDGKFLKIVQRYHYYHLCLFHSRHYARKDKTAPSKLCWADKMSINYLPTWLYLLLGHLSGEIKEYREKNAHVFPLEKSDREWHEWAKEGMVRMATEKNPEAMPYMKKNPGRG